MKIIVVSALFSVFALNLGSCSHRVSNGTVGNDSAVTETAAEQKLWRELKKSDYGKINFHPEYFKKYKMYAMDSAQMRSLLTKAPKFNLAKKDTSGPVIEIPNPDGKLLSFRVYETSTMDSSLASKYPALKTYGGELVNGKATGIRFDFNAVGFHAYVRGSSGEWMIQPAEQGVTHQYLICFYKQDMIAPKEPFEVTDSLKK